MGNAGILAKPRSATGITFVFVNRPPPEKRILDNWRYSTVAEIQKHTQTNLKQNFATRYGKHTQLDTKYLRILYYLILIESPRSESEYY